MEVTPAKSKSWKLDCRPGRKPIQQNYRLEKRCFGLFSFCAQRYTICNCIVVGQMSQHAAIAIGVAHAGDLVELPGAVNGAKEFHRWAQAQGYATTLIIDEIESVTVERLKTAIKSSIANDTERLLIYFAGHGIEPSVNTAYWLLSNWQADSDEAVNVSLSLANAKRTALAQIAVFSDACRSTVTDAALVGGSSIFPKPGGSPAKLPQWDHFFASRLGEVSQEVPGADPTQAYGIFTRCVMQALNGNADKAIEKRDSDLRVVSSGTLAGFWRMRCRWKAEKPPEPRFNFQKSFRDGAHKDIYLTIKAPWTGGGSLNHSGDWIPPPRHGAALPKSPPRQ